MSRLNSPPRPTRVIELTLEFLTTSLAIAIIATAAWAYNTFVTQRSANNPVWLPLWPQHFDTTGTRVLIGTASAITFLNIVYLAMSFVPKFSSKYQPKLSAITLIATSTISFLLAASSVAVFAKQEELAGSVDTLRSWTCQHNNVESYSSLCTANSFAYYGMVVVLAVEVLLVGVGAWRLFMSKPVVSQVTSDKVSDY